MVETVVMIPVGPGAVETYRVALPKEDYLLVREELAAVKSFEALTQFCIVWNGRLVA